jgi:hypothetical protein
MTTLDEIRARLEATKRQLKVWEEINSGDNDPIPAMMAVLRKQGKHLAFLLGEVERLQVEVKAAAWSSKHNYDGWQQEIARGERAERERDALLKADEHRVRDISRLTIERDEAREALAAQRESVHPWQAFLEARADAIDWLHADGKTDAEIAKTLSMDGPVQVYLIRTRHRPSAIRQQDKGEPG